MYVSTGLLEAIITLGAGIAILLIPGLLRYIVAGYLIIVGALALFGHLG